MPSVAVNPPKTPVTKGSNTVAAATVPNICKMPPPPPPFCPTPLPNIGMSSKNPQKYTTTIKVEKQYVAIQGASFDSVGDIASKATGGGVVSNNAEGPTKFIALGALDTKFEGKDVQFLGDQMLNNCGPAGSPANSASLAGATHPPLPLNVIIELLCSILCECLVEAQAKKFESPMGGLSDLAAIEEPDFDGGDPPGKSAFQACAERKFNNDYKETASNVKAEESFNMGTHPPSRLPSSARGMPGTRRPDFVVLDAAGKVTDVIEMKFPGDRYRRGQKKAYKKIAGGKNPTTLTKDTCGC